MLKTLLLTITSLSLSFSFGQSWQDVGGGLSNSTHGLLEWNGQLVVLGSFNNTPCDRVALWDGTNYTCLAGGVGIVARAGCVWNGNLVVVGDFWNNFQPCPGCNGVAVWDGTSWSALDQGFNNDVLTCTVYNGDLIIGGDFTEANGVPINRVARWNPATSTFESMGGVTDMDNDVRCMTVYDGELWVGGDFNNIGGQGPLDGVVKWDETNDVWVGGNSGVDLIGGVNETVRVLYVNPNDGNLYMGGEFPELWDGDAAAEDFNMAGVAMYDGSNWYPLGTGLNEYCRAIHEYNGDLIVGGYFTSADGVACNKIAKWNTTTQTFSPMGLGFDASGIDEYVKAAWTWNGIFFAGGAYTQAEGNPMNYIAQWYEAPTVAPTAAFTPSSTAECEGSCINFQDNSSNGPTSWNWTFPGSSTPSSTDQHPTNICFPTAGTYTISLQSCNTNGCNTATQDIVIESIPTLTANDESVCNGGSVTLTATPSATGGDYLWSTTETTSTISVSPTTTTTYTVEYTLNGCNSGQESVTVTVVNAYNTSENITACENSTVIYPDGSSELITGNTSHSSLLLSSEGCDSTVVTNVTMNLVYNSSENISVCSGTTITYPDGTSETVSANTSYTSSLVSQEGCDSLIVTNVLVNPTYNETENVSVCNGSIYNYPDGSSETITGNTSHTSLLSTGSGCDSVIVTNVSLLPDYNVTENESVCSGANYTYPDGTISNNITVDETHVSTLVTVNGCDSLVTTNITVDPLPNNSVSETNNVITATQSGATYQWLDCDDNNIIILGETGQSYTPTANGNYAVQINLNGCVDTSACTAITTIGLDELSNNVLTIYPNPVRDYITFMSTSSVENLGYEIHDASGRLIQFGTTQLNNKVDVINLAPGTYVLEVEDGKLGRYRFTKL